MKKLLAAFFLIIGISSSATAQTPGGASCSFISYGAVSTAAQWNLCFQYKQDYLGYIPLNSAGGTMTGELITIASTALTAGFNIQQGVAPTTPLNGDIWMTSSGLFARVNGVTVGPFLNASSATFAATNPLVVTFPSGIVTYALNYNSTLSLDGSNNLQINLGSANSWTAIQTFAASGIRLLGSSTGYTILTSANSTASNFTLTLPAVTDTLVSLSASQTLTSKTISGAVLSGTFSGNPIFSGNVTNSGQDINTGTSAPSSASGQTVVMGTIAAPSLSNTGQAYLYNTAVNGAVLQGQGSTYDAVLANKSGAAAIGVTTGTQNVVFTGTITAASLSTPGTIAGSICATSTGLILYDVGVNCFGAGSATSIAPGSTTISPNTNGGCLYSNNAIVGQHPCLTEAQGRLTLTANTPVMTASVSAQTTLRYDCYNGSQVPYYDGTQDNIDTIASCEVTDAMVAGASAGQIVSTNVYDVWWVHSGANRICIAMSSASGGGGGWGSDTGGTLQARGTGYSAVDRTTRAYVTNKNALANCFNGATNYGSVPANQATYLGTVFSSANGQISYLLGGAASGGSAALLGVWNMYNRVSVSAVVEDTGASYTYTTGAVRQARASTGNQIQFVSGLSEDGVAAFYNARETTSGATNATVQTALSPYNSTAGVLTNGCYYTAPAAVAGGFACTDAYAYAPVSGSYTIVATEAGDGVNANTFNTASRNTLNATIRQ